MENKPVKCGCGGEAQILHPSYTHCIVVMCGKCGIKTPYMNTEAEAITAWNLAIGERTAKVRHNGDYFFCAECREGVSLSNLGKDRYCPGCGAKLDWSNDE